MVERGYVFCYIVLNAGAYLDYSLASIMKLVELNPKSGVVIVEGADQFSHPLEKTVNGLSIDGTSDIIDKWVKKYPERIVYCKLGNINDKRESRNKCLELARTLFIDAQYIFNIDGDELIKTNDFCELDQIVSDHPNVLSFWLKQHLFWGDFSGRYANEFAGHKELMFCNTHNLKYSWWHTQISVGNSVPIVKYMPRAVINVDLPYYHYGHICSSRRMWMKRLYSYGQLQWFSRNIERTPMWDESKDHWAAFFKGEPWDEQHWADVELFCPDDHPAEIKQHPWFGWNKEDIWKEQSLYPTFEYEEGKS